MNSNYCNTKSITEQIKAEALRLGFSACGIAPVGEVSPEVRQALGNWLSEGRQADMHYMENYFEKRCDPRLLVEGCRSVISVALNYYPEQQLREDQYQFAWYAYGKDYHDIIRNKLNSLFSFINTNITLVNGRVFCDTAPLLERYWAWRAGLGWIGKHTQLIIPQAGSCFFLGELLIDIELDYDQPQKDRCGVCKLCLEACPTGAISKGLKLDACKCLSYLTIENRNEIPEEYARKLGNKIYGCDECQKACPWNRFATPTCVKELHPSSEFLRMEKDDWESLTREQYTKLFRGSAVKRARYEGLKRNIDSH